MFCFIPKVSCTAWKHVLYSAKNPGKELEKNPHGKGLFKWLTNYTPFERKAILDTYYKAVFVREPFERLASAFWDKHGRLWFKQLFHPHMESIEELRNTSKVTFSSFTRHELKHQTTLETNQHWRAYEQICPCEVNYDFIGHFENLAEEAPQLLKRIGVDEYVSFPEYRSSHSQPYMLEYYSQLTRDEILRLGQIFELDFKLFGYDFPGPLKEVLRNKTMGEEEKQN